MMHLHQPFDYVIGVASTSPTVSIVQPASTSTPHVGGFISQPVGSLNALVFSSIVRTLKYELKDGWLTKKSCGLHTIGGGVDFIVATNSW